MASIKALSLFLAIIFSAGHLFADSGTPATEQAVADPNVAVPSTPAPSDAAVAAKTAEPAVTLAAEKVDPAQVAKEDAEQAKAWAPKEKKKIPLVLQPFEFVITSVVNAIWFWKKD